MTWDQTLRDRLDRFRSGKHGDGIAVSVKVRVESGCFCENCWPVANRLIDDAVSRGRHDDYGFEKHESGPELLLYLAVTAGGITLAKSVIDLVTTIIKARSEGEKKGDKRHEPLELIVRGFDTNGKMFEEKVLRISSRDEPSRKAIEKALLDGLQKQLPPPPAKAQNPPKAKPAKRQGKKK